MSYGYLCVGGPYDGQYYAVKDGCISFRVVRTPPVQRIATDASMEAPPTEFEMFEYLLLWSREHGRFIWWCAA